MAKKQFKSKMQKQKDQTKTKTNKTTKTKNTPIHQLQTNLDNEIHHIAKKFEALGLKEESQTQHQQIKMKNIKKKSTTKKQSATKSTQKTIKSKQKTKKSTEEDIKTLEDQTVLTQFHKLQKSLCNLHFIRNQEKKSQQKSPLNEKLTFQWFKKIRSIWIASKQKLTRKTLQTSKNEILKQQSFLKKTQRVTYVPEITQYMIERLKPKHWLNDEVINSYIQLMDLDISKKSIEKTNLPKEQLRCVHLFQSFFAALKVTSQRIQREIKKKGLTRQSLIIIPINEDYHWFFLMIVDHKIFICDSILPKSVKHKQGVVLLKKDYLMKESVRRCIQLYQRLYLIEKVLQDDIGILKEFPQQDNQNDCGMMMLCGMKNVLVNFLEFQKKNNAKSFVDSLESHNFWNFCVKDITFYRFLHAKEIILERIQHY